MSTPLRSMRKEDLARRDFDFAVNPFQTLICSDLRIQAFVQSQTKVGIFCAVFGSLLDGYLIETDLAGAFAAKRFEWNGLQAKMAQCKLAEVMSAHTLLA